jgi:hypothetical protein
MRSERRLVRDVNVAGIMRKQTANRGNYESIGCSSHREHMQSNGSNDTSGASTLHANWTKDMCVCVSSVELQICEAVQLYEALLGVRFMKN